VVSVPVAPEAEEPVPTARPPRSPRQKSPGVAADDTLAEAGRKVFRFHFDRLLAREAGTRSGDDPEDLHAMRVATRRIRAAWRVFGDAYRPGLTRTYRRETRQLAGRLGAVRDLDVLLGELDRYREADPLDGRLIEPLAASWRARRDAARALLLRELDTPRYARFVEEFGAFTTTEGMAARPVAPTVPHRVRDTAPARIWAAYGDVRAYEGVLRWADAETLHELRIAGKWLRYSLEFVRDALGPEADLLIDRVVALQDHLGLMNDAHVSAGLARTFLVDQGAALSPAESAAIGRYLVEQERESGRLRRTAGRPFRVIGGPPFRRTLARLVARL
jgi:CHAD domain-containing protein